MLLDGFQGALRRWKVAVAIVLEWDPISALAVSLLVRLIR